VKAAAPEPNGRRRAARSARYGSASKNIENNPMHSKEPLEKKGVAGRDFLLAKNILTRRANQWHIFIITKFVRSPLRYRVVPAINAIAFTVPAFRSITEGSRKP
jgi:hypothetical protein